MDRQATAGREPGSSSNEIKHGNSIALSKSVGGVANTDLTEWIVNNKSLVEEFSMPAIGDKDGSYFIRCTGTKRNNDDTADIASVIILDGDSRINEDGEIISGAPDPALINEFLTKLKISHCIYSSHSNGATASELAAKGIDSGGMYGTDYHKYRVIIPCVYSPEQLPALLDYLFNELHKAGVMLAPVSENRTWSQAWYFPRVPDPERLALFKFYRHDGVALDVDQIHKDWLKNQPEPVEPVHKAYEPQQGESLPGWINPLKRFNQTDSCHDVLTRNSYPQKGLKYLRPDSESKIPGVQLCLNCKDGVERVYSHGGDVLNDGYAHDAFDCMRLLEYDGNWRAALRFSPEINANNAAIWRQAQIAAKTAPQSPPPNESDATGTKPPTFKLVSIKHLIDNPVPVKWTIKNIFEKGGVNVMSGSYGSGKSFVAFDMAFCVAAGIDWHGHAVIQSPVVILCGEGHSAIADRFSALAIEYGVNCPAGLYVSEVPAQLTDSANCDWVAAAVNQLCPDAGMVIVDTLNRNFGGLDENSTKDMTIFVGNVDAVFRTTGKTVLVVHHAGHNGDRGRGSIVLPGSCEGEFFIKKQDNGLVLTCPKQKNAPEAEPHYFKFKPVALPGRVDDDGEPVGSLCLELTDGAGKVKRRKLSARNDVILTSLNEVIATHGVNPSPEIKLKFSGFDSFAGKMQKVVHIDYWREQAYKAITIDVDSSKTDALKKAFKRCRDKLFNDGFTVEHGDYVWRVYE